MADSSSRTQPTCIQHGVVARAKAEAARTQAAYAEMEAKVMIEQAQVQAKLHVLKLEKDAATASAEAAVYEAAEENKITGSQGELDLQFEPLPPAQRTSEYVLQHSHESAGESSVVSGPLTPPLRFEPTSNVPATHHTAGASSNVPATHRTAGASKSCAKPGNSLQWTPLCADPDITHARCREVPDASGDDYLWPSQIR